MRAWLGPVPSVLLLQAPALLTVVAPPAAVALLMAQWDIALALASQTAALIAIILLRAERAFPSDLRQIEALAAFALLFRLTSAIVVPPFVIPGMPMPDEVFEAVSGITSTGFSVARGTEDWPIVAHLLRGWIQWCCGFAIAFAGLAIFAGSPGAAVALGGSSIAARDNL